MRATRATVGAGALAVALGLTACSSGQSAPTATPTHGDAGPDYRDGEFTATGWCGSLPSHHDVTLTIDGGTVTAVAITTPADDETSLGFQQRFAAALPEAVIGRDIDDLAIDRLAGSSGCSQGFMDALAKIKEQALEGRS